MVSGAAGARAILSLHQCLLEIGEEGGASANPTVGAAAIELTMFGATGWRRAWCEGEVIEKGTTGGDEYYNGRMKKLFVFAAICGASWGADWKPMFDGTSLNGWTETAFRGRGLVVVKDGVLTLGKGRLTGVTWAGEFPKTGYEIRFEAVRMEGNDFFAGLTFPVGEAYCTWVNGGWGGTVVGLSSLDGDDASENDTSTLRDFVQGRWYGFRLEVTEKRVRGWIDEALVIETDIVGRQVGLREVEMELNAPLGFSAYATVGGLRKVEYRRLEAI